MQGDGARGRLHSVAAADKQRIVKHIAQARERAADRGLPEMQFIGRERHALFAKQHRKCDKQVEIDFAEIVFFDSHYGSNQLE